MDVACSIKVASGVICREPSVMVLEFREPEKRVIVTLCRDCATSLISRANCPTRMRDAISRVLYKDRLN